MRYQSKPQYSEFLMPPEETFKAKPAEQRQTTPQKEDKKEAEFQYNIKLVCSSAEVRHYKIKSFLLASTDQETTANTSWAESPNQDSTGIILTTSVYVNEPKALHYQFAGTKNTAFSYENVKPVKKGDLSHTESFIPVKPSVQIGERLGWPTEGYFYHFIDDEFVHEYKIQGDDRWAFSATESTKESLSDSLLSSQLTTILLPWKINGKTIGRQHLLFKKEKITKEILDNEINPDWLDEHACLLNMRDIAATRTVPILDTEKQEGDNIIYVIKAGDTLSKIANRHGITLGKLIELNPKYKDNPNAINVGEKITIETKQEATPQLEFHVCQIDPETNQRETWSQIAAKYSLAPKELLELNKHYDSDPTALAVGDKLNVKTKSQDITTPEKRNTLPAEDITTDKTVYAFSNAQCTASDKTHFNVLPIIDLGQADKNTPVIKTNKVVLKSKLLSNSDALELLAKDKGILIKKGSKGPEVKAIQEALLAMKIDIGSSTSDEVFGNNTYNAIKQFQETFVVTNTIHPKYQIGKPDGIVGKGTLFAIDEALNIGWRVSNHFWSIIFNEVGSIKNDNVYNQLVQVFDAKNELLIEVKGSSKPNPFKPKSPSIKGENAYPHVKSGSYLVEHGLHKGKPALVLNSNKYVPTTKINPNYPEYGKNANYIHVHWGYSKTWKGSAGCMTIHPDDWKRFLSSIPNGKGEITIP